MTVVLMNTSATQSGTPKNTSPFIFSIEGNIGTGKSSFLDIIGTHLNRVQIMKEPIDKWTKVGSPDHPTGGGVDGGGTRSTPTEGGSCNNNLLDMFYNDPVRWSYTFQTRCSFTKAMQYDHITEPVVFAERSWLSDRYVFTETLYEMNMMSKIEKEMHNDWFTWLNKKTPKIDAIIYLKASPNVSFDRLINRNRHEEASMNFGYLSIVDKKYNEWLIEGTENDVPVLVIDVDEEFRDIEHRHKEILDTVVRAFPFLTKHLNQTQTRVSPTGSADGVDDIQFRPQGWTTVRKKKPRATSAVRRLRKSYPSPPACGRPPVGGGSIN